MAEFIIYKIENFALGLNLKQDPIVTPNSGGISKAHALIAENCDFRDGVSIQSRDGYGRQIANTYSKNIVGIFPFYVDDTLHLLVMTWDGTDYVIYDSTTSKKTGTASAIYFNPAVYNNLCFITHAGNSDSEDYNLKYDGTNIRKLGIDAPEDSCTVETVGTGEAVYGGTSVGTLLRWNGSDAWEQVAPALGSSDWVMGLVVLSSVLYGGLLSTGKLQAFNGSDAWEEKAGKLSDNRIFSPVLVFGGKIYAGSDTATYGNLLEWNGSDAWVVKGTVGDDTIYSIAEFNEKIYVGTGDGKLYEWDGDETLTEKASKLGDADQIFALIAFNSKLYGATEEGTLLEWNGTDAWVQKAPALDGEKPINCLLEFDSKLYAGTGTNGLLLEWNNSDAWDLKAPKLGNVLSIHSLVEFNEKLYGGTEDGTLLEWNDADAWAEKAPVLGGNTYIESLVTHTQNGNLTGEYFYYYSYYNEDTGHESALSPQSLAVSPSAQRVTLTNIVASSDDQVTHKRIYRTGGNLTTKNCIGQITNATTTFTDNIAEISVGLAEDCDTNQVLAAVRYFTMHHHQLFGAYNALYPGFIYDSRFYKPEAFPITLNDDGSVFSGFFYKAGNATDYIVAAMPLGIDVIVYTRFKMHRYRYIGESEENTVLEEIADVGLVSDNTLVMGIKITGKPMHIFLGRSSRGRGIYLYNGEEVVCISGAVEPIFSGERASAIVPPDITTIDWDHINLACASFCGGRYYLGYTETGQESPYMPNKILVVDLNTDIPKWSIYGIPTGAMSYNVVTDRLMFGGVAKEVYYLTNTHDWVSGAKTGIALVYQTAYFGDRATYGTMESLTFHADTQGQTLTVTIYADFSSVATLTCSTTSMKRVKLSCPPECVGRLFSIRFTVTGTTTDNQRIKISPPLECKIIPWKK